MIVTARRHLALAVCGAALLVPSLSGCGFHLATDRVYTPAAGVNYRDGVVKVLNAAIVSKTDGSGTFVASLVNDDQSSPVTMTAVSGDGTAIANVDVKPVQVPANSLVNLSDGHPVHVSGGFAAGDFVTVQIEFDNGEADSLDVPVVKDDGQWAGLDSSKPTAVPSASPTAAATS